MGTAEHSLSIVDVPCGLIAVADRYRKDLGDLEALAASIASEGLLQPIGITEDNQLVFGERRLRAVQTVLNRATIPARVVRVSSLVSGEYTENELRKDFSPSERHAIGEAVKAELGSRQGQRSDIELGENIPEVQKGRTDEIAAKKAGFGNRKTYEQVGKVIATGAPEIVTAMDAGDISIHAASIIATEPPARQAEIAAMPVGVRRQIVREIKEAAKLPTPSEARKLAKETGLSVADNTNHYQSGASAAEVKANQEEMVLRHLVTSGIEALAETAIEPFEFGRTFKYWYGEDIRERAPKAATWIATFLRGLEANETLG